jgi:hypothetical protein
MNLPVKTLAAAMIVGSVSSLAGSAGAVPLSASAGLRDASTSPFEAVQWRRGWGGWGGWGGIGVGLAAGAIIGGAIAASTYGYGYGYPGYYGYGYAPAYYGGYGYGPVSGNWGGYAYAPAYYGYAAPRYYAPAFYGYAAYPRYRSRVYVRSPRRWTRW